MPKRGPIELELIEMLAVGADADEVGRYLAACLPEVFSADPISAEAYANGPSTVVDVIVSTGSLPLTADMDIMGAEMPSWARHVSLEAWFHLRYKPAGDEGIRMLPAVFLTIYAEGVRDLGQRKEVFNQRFRPLDDTIGRLHELCRIWER